MISLAFVMILVVGVVIFKLTPPKFRRTRIMLGTLCALILAGAGFFLAIIPNTPQFFGTAVRCVETDEKVIALTYDDGPRPPTTQGVLDVLLKHQVYATFFLIGENAEKNRDLVKKIYSAGHELGNHTYSHPVLIWRSPSFVREQIEKTDRIIRDCGYNKEIFFRSPKGMKFIFDAWELSSMNRTNILFDVASWDWESPGVNKIVDNVVHDVKPGSIILLHDGYGDKKDVVTASDIIITKLKAQGYRFLTISELLKKDKQHRFV